MVIRACVLDTVSVEVDGGPVVVIGSLQQKVLLTLLVANSSRSVSLDAIADELWPDVRPRRWRGCLATLANALRTAAGDRDFIASTDRGYVLHRRRESVVTDVEELYQCLDGARRAEEEGADEAAERLARRAMALYGSGPWTTDYWGWNEAAADAAWILGKALLRRHSYVACISELSRVIDDVDWHEGVWECLIAAHEGLQSARRLPALLQKARLALGPSTPLFSRLDEHLTLATSA
jgi:DNA-binding SARP family transcriptional activator